MLILVDIEELKKLETETGLKLKRLEKADLKWRMPPDWEEKKFDALVVEVPEDVAPDIFEKYRVRHLRKPGQ
ncbi:MAG TPA: hypothetical protein ENN60_00575 [archaeon]|nr:hypothetical protein [archaeon]